MFWGILAIAFALFANLAENLIQAVNIVGSIFYGVVLAMFLVGVTLAGREAGSHRHKSWTAEAPGRFMETRKYCLRMNRLTHEILLPITSRLIRNVRETSTSVAPLFLAS